MPPLTDLLCRKSWEVNALHQGWGVAFALCPQWQPLCVVVEGDRTPGPVDQNKLLKGLFLSVLLWGHGTSVSGQMCVLVCEHGSSVMQPTGIWDEIKCFSLWLLEKNSTAWASMCNLSELCLFINPSTKFTCDHFRVLVGAPRAQKIGGQRSTVTGGLYSCDMSSASAGCNRVIFDNTGETSDIPHPFVWYCSVTYPCIYLCPWLFVCRGSIKGKQREPVDGSDRPKSGTRGQDSGKAVCLCM